MDGPWVHDGPEPFVNRRIFQEGKYIPYTEKDPRLLTELLARVKVGSNSSEGLEMDSV